MKETFLITILLILLVLYLPHSVYALGVSDPTSHIYLAEQVSQLTEQLEQMEAQLNEAVKANETLTKSYEAVTSTYTKFNGVYDDIMKTKAFLNDSYNTVLNQYGHYKDLYEELADPDKGDIETIKGLLEGVFSDPRTMSSEERRKQAEQAYQVQQEALKKAIEDGEHTLNTMPERAEKLKELGTKVGKTADTKESQALTNTLLLEILEVLQEQLALTLRFQQAMALQSYSGITEDSIKIRADALKHVVLRKDVIGKELANLRQAGMTDMTDIKSLIHNNLDLK
ncbi:MAG: hypothetical protein CL942_08440 [Desulfovibrio sp.]|nr:hypothetical protein [Desulfovibrio sp.]|tara:strand:- start:1135 stop:1986 length:852 start_codon:yes stop_codon:yes gene_type:complete